MTDGAIVVEVDAGWRPRRRTAISVEVPEEAASASVVDVATNAALACQLDRADSPPRVWWIIRSLAAEEKRRYRIEFSKEAPPAAKPAVRIRRGATGLQAAVDERRVWELLAGEFGRPRLVVRPGREPLATLEAGATPRPARVTRTRTPRIETGPVFAAVTLHYEQRDRFRDRVIGRERHVVRFFAGTRGERTFTWEIGWAACAGPIHATGEDARAPALDVKAGPDAELVIGPGWSLAELQGPWPALSARVFGPKRAFGLFQQPRDRWSPFFWSREDRNFVRGAAIGPHGSPGDLEAGEVGTTTFFGALVPRRNAERRLARKRFDFDAGPTWRAIPGP
ncbi:MAG TPA: hypothetical protein VNC50_05900 [Planctomycetia bacterium]|nr:hypothetical protein [Planctomycetia bacterium]